MSPNSFPNEILYKIFSSIHFDDTQFTALPTTLSHVCGRWRDIALDLPAFWTRVRLRVVETGNGRLAAENREVLYDILRRSQRQPISIFLDFQKAKAIPKWNRDIDLTVVTPHAYRCRFLSIAPMTNTSCETVLRFLIPGCVVFPRLEVLELNHHPKDVYRKQVEFQGQRFPQISSLSFRRCIVTLPIQFPPKLKSLEMADMTIYTGFAHHYDKPGLTHLTFRSIAVHPYPRDNHWQSRISSVTRLSLNNIFSPNDIPGEALEFYEELIFPNLEELELCDLRGRSMIEFGAYAAGDDGRLGKVQRLILRSLDSRLISSALIRSLGSLKSIHTFDLEPSPIMDILYVEKDVSSGLTEVFHDGFAVPPERYSCRHT